MGGARGLDRVAVAQHHARVALGRVLRPRLLARAGDRARVAQQVDEARVGPAGGDQVGDEDVVRRLVDEDRLARGGQLAVQQPVPEQEAQLLLLQPDLAERLGRVVRLDLDRHVAQVQLLRRVDARVAVEQHAQQGRARAHAAHHEHGRLQQPVARLAGRAPAAPHLGPRAAELVARGARERAVHRPLQRHARQSTTPSSAPHPPQPAQRERAERRRTIPASATQPRPRVRPARLDRPSPWPGAPARARTSRG